jgi:predicted ATPase/class 3 adenylate cyclase/Tfp pilus assembly protein PilF
MCDMPSGTVTLLFTDIEGSTRLLMRLGDHYPSVLAAHREILREAFHLWNGHEVDTQGDAFFVVFQRATDAVAAALAAQRALAAYPWPEGTPLRVRMALHTGEPIHTGSGYVGLDVHHAARLCSAGHGGQVLLSQTTHDLVANALPHDVHVRDMGAHRLKDLPHPEQIFQLAAPDLPSDFLPLKTLDSRPNNLPATPAPLIGREHEVEAACALLRQAAVRLLTLTGPGGIGKTRIALQVAAALLDHFVGGVFFVALAPINDPDLVAATIAQTLGVREAAGKPLAESLMDYLQNKDMLLVLDNFEQVVEAAPLLAGMLAGCPKLKVLITSRAVLHLSGEHEFVVPPLASPDPRRLPDIEALAQYEAIRLFVERAQAVKADFALTNENALAVAEICQRLDGLPLAIELAAARSKLFAPSALLARLAGTKRDSSLRLLTGGARDLPARQQTLRSAIDWSYDLLDAGEQTLFARLGVFVGGWTLEAAEAVCQFRIENEELRTDPDTFSIFEGLAALVDKSLLRQEAGVDGEPRFTMLGTIREYALERLVTREDAESSRHLHAWHYLALAEAAEPALTGPQQALWLARLEQEHDNMRAALQWLLDRGEAETAIRLSGALGRFWYVHGHPSEGRRWLEGALAQSHLHAGVQLPAAVRSKALNGAGALAWMQGDYVQATTFFTESLALRRELGDKQGIASSLGNLGLVALRQGEYERAEALLTENLALYRELGHQRGIARALNNLGVVTQHQGNYDRATAFLEESMALQRGLGDKGGIASSLANLGEIARYQGDYARATALYEESLALYRELGDRNRIVDCLEGLAVVAGAKEQAARAARLFGAAEALRESIGMPVSPADRASYNRNVGAVRTQMDAGILAEAWAAGRAMSLEQVITEALTSRN